MNASVTRAGIIVGIFAAAIAAFFAFSAIAPSTSLAATGKPHWLLQLKDGTVDIALLPELAPKHVAQIITLTDRGFYNGIVFHRVIEGFMAQSGDPTGTGSGGSDLPDVPAEFSNEPFVRDVVGGARSNDPNSFNSQFFITLADATFLNGQYTVFGKVVSGMEFVDNIKKGAGDTPVVDPDKIISAKIEYK